MLRRLCFGLFRALGVDGTPLGTAIRRLGKSLAPRSLLSSTRGILQKPPDTTGILVAFRVSGGIGDHLLAARYIRDLMAASGEFRFDIYSPRPEIAALVFGHMAQFNRCYDEYFSWRAHQHHMHYPLAMWVSQFVVLLNETVDWPRLNKDYPKLVRICETIDRVRHARFLDDIVNHHPFQDNLLGLKAVFMNASRQNLAHIMSGIAYGGDSLPIPVDRATLERFGLDKRPYVTIHNGFDAEFQTGSGFASRSTKVYPRFDTVVAALRKQRPDLLIVQLGTRTSQPIAGVDHQLMNRTSLAETASLLAGSALHIDNEGGLVHLAACLGTRCCVVFGPTPVDYFGYGQNVNIAPKECGSCWWVTRDWMTNCPRGFENPVCLSKTSPETVVEAMLSLMTETRDAKRGATAPEHLPGPDRQTLARVS
jgi:hypothetical protein